MRVEFVAPQSGPERLVAEAEIVFENNDGPLDGMKLVGFALWRSPEGEVYVTFPSRSFGQSTERRYFDYLRSADGDPSHVRRVKEWIASEFRARNGSKGGEAVGA